MSEGHAGPVIHSGFARTPAERAERALVASVGRTTAEYLLQHRAALETLRTAFNALEAKQRQQAATLIELVGQLDDQAEDQRRAVTGLRLQCLIFARTLGGRLRWLVTGS